MLLINLRHIYHISIQLNKHLKIPQLAYRDMFAITKPHYPLHTYLNLKVKNKFNEMKIITAKVSYGLFDGINDIQYEPSLENQC